MYYYELLHTMSKAGPSYPGLKPGIYVAQLCPPDIPPLAFHAERIWEEIGDNVRYWKHRECEPPVDMKEFTWIKLTAKVIE